jgi:homoserine dehydrogenase
MFSFGAGFEESLRDAQQKGYAESNPDADILGTDACRKIAILASLVTGRLISTDKIHTEGITAIRAEDVAVAEKLGMKIKLLGRCIIDGEQSQIMVAPFMLGGDLALAHVDGVYNAIEVLGEPIGSVMFYGPGAGGGATASAMVGDLVQIMRSGRATAHPTMVKTEEGLADFAGFKSRNYVALSGVNASVVNAVIENAQIISEGDELAFITPEISEAKVTEAIEALTAQGATLKSRIRLV